MAQKNKILFKINDQIITSIDLLEEAKYLIAINDELKNSEKNIIYEISKKSLIRNKIKEIELKKRLKNLDIDEQTLNKILVNYFRRININSNQDLELFLKKKNINRKYIEKKIKIDVLWNEFIFTKYSKNVKIDQDKIKNELKNKTKQNEFLLSEILFNLKTNENLDKKFNLIREIIETKGFAEAALSFSNSNSAENGGDLGWIKETSLNKKIRNKIINIKVGDYSKPIVIPGGFLILKINDIKTSEIDFNLEEAIKQVSTKQTNEQLNQFSNIYFNKIRKDITINEF